VAHADRADLDEALEAAAKGFKVWRAVAPFERCRIMRKAAAIMRERNDEIAPLMTMEQGKTLAEAKMEAMAAADVIEWFAEEAKRAYGRVIPARGPGIYQIAVKDRAHVLFADADGVVRIGLAAPGGDVAAGVVDENVDRTQFLRRGLDHPRDLGAIGEIAEHPDGADPMRRCNVCSDRRQRRSLAIFSRAMLAHAVDGDIGAEACQPFGKGPAQAAARAGDQRNLALQRPGGVECRHVVFS
jgi:hypothetical protein